MTDFRQGAGGREGISLRRLDLVLLPHPTMEKFIVFLRQRREQKRVREGKREAVKTSRKETIRKNLFAYLILSKKANEMVE